MRQAVEDWLAYGQLKAGSVTRQKNRHLCETHVLPQLGARKLRELTAVEVENRWLPRVVGVVVDQLAAVGAGVSESLGKARDGT